MNFPLNVCFLPITCFLLFLDNFNCISFIKLDQIQFNWKSTHHQNPIIPKRMAGSRVEKLSTIFKRYTGLVKTGAVLAENRPVWYDIYEKFPPKVEPLAIRDEPTESVQNVYYPEDILRARFSRVYGDQTVTYDFFDSTKKHNNACETFIGKYLQIAAEKAKSSDNPEAGIDLNDSKLFAETEQVLRSEFGFKLRRRTTSSSE